MARNQWEITGPPEIRGDGNYSYFRPYPPPTADKPIGNLDREPGLDRDERYLVLLFLRLRYVVCTASAVRADARGCTTICGLAAVSLEPRSTSAIANRGRSTPVRCNPGQVWGQHGGVSDS